jgi:hypothetical protein
LTDHPSVVLHEAGALQLVDQAEDAFVNVVVSDFESVGKGCHVEFRPAGQKRELNDDGVEVRPSQWSC